MANETGGQVTFNTNNFNLGLEKLIEEQGSFYLLAYEPNPDIFLPQNNKFNKLEVKLKKRGYNVRYRSGFFGIENSKNQTDSKNNSPAQQLSRVISSPFTNNGVGLKLNTLFGVDEDNVSYLNSLLYIEGKDLTFIDKVNSKEAIFDILAVIFDETGNPIDEYSSSYNIDLKGDAYKKLQDDGFFYSFIFPIKKPGAYQMRVALRDANNLRIGSANQFVEIPDLRKNKLILSGILLENLTMSQWQELQNPSSSKSQRQTNPLQDTSLRRFKRGTILRYASEIYNSKLNPTQKPNISTKIRIFQDNKLVLDGKNNLMNTENQNNLKNLIFTGMLTLGEEMSVGNYVLQIIVTDNLAPQKDNITAQSIQFEIID